jgi:hypothetical protein
VKKKTAKIEKERARPKLDRAQLDALVKELSRPERLAQEVGKLVRLIRSDRRLLGLRFAPAALAAAATELAGAEKGADGLLDRLVTEDFALETRRVLESCARETAKLEDLLPFRVGLHMLEAAREKGRPASQNPVYAGILSASAFDMPIALALEGRPADEVVREAREGRAGESLRRFFEEDARVRALRDCVGGFDIEAVCIHAQLGFTEGHEIALPLEAALMGPIEARRAGLRRRALAGIGAVQTPADEQARILAAALERDAERAIPAFRRELVARLEEAAREAASAATAARGERRFASIWALCANLELLPPTRVIPLIAAYETAAPRAIEEADPASAPLLKALFVNPLDPAPYGAYARHLAASAPERARAFAAAALAAFPGDAALSAVKGG